MPKKALADKHEELRVLTKKYENLIGEHARLVAQIENLKQDESAQKSLHKDAIAELQTALDSIKS